MPTIPKYGKLSDATNEQMLNAIHNDASLDYQRRIPRATQAGLSETLDALTEYKMHWNEFINAFINKIGKTVAHSKVYTNKLREFKKGMVPNGHAVEEYNVGLLKAYNINEDYDYGEGMLFATEKPDVQSNFHTLNRTDMYKLSVNESILRRAFLDEGGLASAISEIMNAPTNSDEVDEQKLMTRLLWQFAARGGYHRVQIPDIADIDSTADDVRRGLRIMRSLVETLTFPSTHYNAAKMATWVNADDLVIFTIPEFRAAIDVEALAGMFNMSKGDVPSRIVTLPREEFNYPGAQAIITSRDHFQVYDTLVENTSIFNPVKLQTNHFFHHQGIYSLSRFTPAVMLTTGPGDEVITVSHTIASIGALTTTDVDGETVTALEPGMVYEVHAPVTVEPDNVQVADNWGIVYRLEGNNSSKTQITQKGIIRVSPTETSDEVTIIAADANADVVLERVTMSVARGVDGPTAPEWPIDRDPEPDPAP